MTTTQDEHQLEAPLTTTETRTEASQSDDFTKQLNNKDTEGITKMNVINLVAYVVNVAITYGIGVGGLFNLPDNAVVSAKYQTLVTPAGWAFAIWGLIFISQAVWVAAPLLRPGSRIKQGTIGHSYVWIVAAQALWTLAFGNELIALSGVIMVIVCALLWKTVQTLWREQHESLYFLYVFPFTLHAGWITAATAVNFNLVLVAFETSTSIQFWCAVASLLALSLAAGDCIFFAGDTTMPLVLAWALTGVYAELQSPKDSIAQTFSGSQVDLTATGSIVLAAVIASLAIVAKVFSLRFPQRA